MVVTDTFLPVSGLRVTTDVPALVDVVFHGWAGGHQPGPSVGAFCSDILSCCVRVTTLGQIATHPLYPLHVTLSLSMMYDRSAS